MSTISYVTTLNDGEPSLRFRLRACLSATCPIEDLESGVLITTHCMYPSNGLVRVIVNAGLKSIVVSDGGEALGEALAAGVEINDPDKLLRNFVRHRGLEIKNGVICSSVTPIEAAPVAILHVANVAKEVAHWLYDHGGLRRKADFRELLSNFLANEFKQQVAETKLLGASHKAHTFANVISFANGRRFIVDAVSNDASSINARLVANLDVKANHDPMIDQRIIYDDTQSWSAADLKLLQNGASVVPFSKAQPVIQRIAHELRTGT